MKDRHLHTTFGDGKSSIDDMVKTAKALGFEEIAFTEHFTQFFVDLNKGPTIRPEQIEDYYNQCRSAEQKYGINVLKGFEIGYLEGDREATLDLMEKVSPDLLLLSVHHLDLLQDWKHPIGLDMKAGYSVYARGDTFSELCKQYGGFTGFCEAYFARLNNAIHAGFEDVCSQVGVAHLDMFIHPENWEADSRKSGSFTKQAAELIANKGLSLELNFHYFHKDGKSRPGFDIAEHFLRSGGTKQMIWSGSDSHSTEQLKESAQHYHIFEDTMVHMA